MLITWGRLQMVIFSYFREVQEFPVVIVESNDADYLTKSHYSKFTQLLNKKFKNGITNIKNWIIFYLNLRGMYRLYKIS